MRFVTCTYDQHARAIHGILNDAIINTTALYEYEPRPFESMVNWFENKKSAQFPVVGTVSDDDQLMGFATYGNFRPWAAYKYTVEHSVYVHRSHRCKGLGLALMEQLIDLAKEQQYHVMVGGIDLTNIASIVLHEKLGFSHAGTVKQAAFKFGRWLDLAFYQLVFETPAKPVDG